jgi:hypothetical protein
MRSDRLISWFGVATAVLGFGVLVLTAGTLKAQQPGRILGRVLDAGESTGHRRTGRAG